MGNRLSRRSRRGGRASPDDVATDNAATSVVDVAVNTTATDAATCTDDVTTDDGDATGAGQKTHAHCRGLDTLSIPDTLGLVSCYCFHG